MLSRTRFLAGAAALGIAVTAGCSSQTGQAPASAGAAMAPEVVASGDFEPYQPGQLAVTYNPSLVPAGAHGEVSVVKNGEQTAITLSLTGLRPSYSYGAHVHTKACGVNGADAGGHYQNQADPRQPSTDPAFANPRNEVWLDFTTSAQGDARVTATVPWTFRPSAANSVVLHERHTGTEPGHAGDAGPRLACLTAHF